MAASSSANDGTGGPIFGRERELARVGDLVDRLPERGSALLVRGEAGIGKSTLLAAASRRAEAAGMRVLRATGVQSEAKMPFAGLHQLLLPVFERVEHLPTRQREALLAAFGMTEVAAPDRFLIALAALELLSDAAARTPILIVIDDAQWLDLSSAETLAFVARRVEHEPIAVLVASRDGVEGPFDEAGLPGLGLGGLGGAAAQSLLAARAPRLAPAVRERLLDEAGGNPLALVELPVVLGEDELGGRAPLPAPLPLTERLERAFAARVAGLPEPTRTLLLLAAADEGGALGEVLAAAEAIDGDEHTAEGFVPAIDARLISVDGIRLAFRHPLVRSAVYQTASIVERHAAHSALAKVLADQPDRQVWHPAMAAVGPDERVAAGLEAFAQRARRRGAISVAIDALVRAVETSEDRMRKGRRLLDAAELAFEMGRRELVLRLVNEAEPLGLGRRELARIAWIRESFNDGVPADTSRVRSLVEVANSARGDGDTDLALKLLTGAALRAWWADPGEEAREDVVGAAELLNAGENDPRLLAILAIASPIDRGAPVLDRLSRLPSDDGAGASHLLAQAAYAAGDFERADGFLTDSIARLRSQGRLALLAQALAHRAWATINLGRWDVAGPAAEECRRLALETAQPIWAAGARVAEAALAGIRGDEGLAEALAAQAEREMLPARVGGLLAVVQLARGLAALGGERHADAYEHLRRTFDPADPAYHYMERFWAIGYLAEAAVHSGHRDSARAIIGELEPLASRTPSPVVRMAMSYARPLLADDGAAEPLFQRALTVDLTRWPFARARLQLAYGAWLRRRRRVVESRGRLDAAREAFEALGAAPWAERARHELRAAGVASRPREPTGTDELTPQELQIARMAASGLSNREIGQQLYLSHRTVGTHLYRTFPKLGITSRAQLRSALDETLPR